MDGATLATGLLPRGEAVKESQRALAHVDGLERERRIRRLVTVGGGWAVASLMTAVAGACLAVMWVRPVPKDTPFVIPIHDDGTWSPAVPRDDLTAGQKAILFVNTVTQYVKARENYTWGGVNAQYLQVSAMSTPAERARYQGMMLDPKAPDNPEVLYGSGISAATAFVTSIVVRPDAGSPYSVHASFVLKVQPPGRPALYLHKTAAMTWMDARDAIPKDIQQQYDPAGVAFISYDSSRDPEGPKQ